MFFPPNRNSSVSRALLLKYILAAVIVFGTVKCAGEKSGRQSAARPSPPRNPIEEMLRPAAPVAYRDGVAAIILVDTSGSMRDKVKDAEGQLQPKIKLARRAVLSLVQQFHEFALDHGDLPLLVGIYEFSVRERKRPCRKVVPLGPPDPVAAKPALEAMKPEGGTPIGDAMIAAKRDLDATALARRHMLVVTDGKNTRGYAPEDVADVISRQSKHDQASIYFVAFDIEAERFDAVRDSGALVLAAASERDLNQTLNYLLTGKILVEQPIHTR